MKFKCLEFPSITLCEESFQFTSSQKHIIQTTFKSKEKWKYYQVERFQEEVFMKILTKYRQKYFLNNIIKYFF